MLYIILILSYTESDIFVVTTGKEMVDFITDYLETIRKRRVFPDVKPGYMRHLLPESAPLNGEDWNTIFADIERVIMPGMLSLLKGHI